MEKKKSKINHKKDIIVFRNRLPPTEPNQFNILTWNTLNEHACSHEKFPRCSSKDLAFARRIEKILLLISCSNADIICLQVLETKCQKVTFFQELDCTKFEKDFAPLWAQGYEFVLQKRNKKLEEFSAGILKLFIEI